MKFKKTAAAMLLSAAVMAQSTVGAYAEDRTAEVPEQSAAVYSDESLPTLSSADVLYAIETAFVESDPELIKLSQYVFEGDTLPCSQNDPSYHKYIQRLMQQRVSSGGSLTAMLGSGLLTRAITAGKKLIHQARFKDHIKTFGVDVSYYQGAIDWNKLKAEGVTFAIIRVGYRGYGSAGTLVEDDRFKEYIDGATKAGLQVGVYFFTQAITTKEAEAEADFVYQRIKNYKLDLPVYFDMEEISSSGRLEKANLSVAQKTAIVEAFCNRINSKGYQGAVYSNASWLLYKLNGTRLQQLYPLWFANYINEEKNIYQTNYTFSFDIWQYGCERLNGANGDIDMNVRYQLPPAPGKVTGLKIERNTEETAKVSWNAVPGSTGYELCRLEGTDSTVLANVKENYAEVPIENAEAELYVRAYITVNGTPYFGDESEKVKPDDSLFKEALKGDINGDGVFDRLDVNLIARYCGGWTGYERYIDPVIADINGDGEVNRLDANILCRCAGGWEGYTEKYILPFTDYRFLAPADKAE